jgi:hypothetical protein
VAAICDHWMLVTHIGHAGRPCHAGPNERRQTVVGCQTWCTVTSRPVSPWWARRCHELADAQQQLDAALAEKEHYLRGREDPVGRQVLQLAQQRGAVLDEQREVREALAAAEEAAGALAVTGQALTSAAGWSAYDTFFGGGLISSAVKHSRLDEAAYAATEADRRLAVLRSELADVEVDAVALPGIRLGSGTRFLDICFDNIITDFAVRNRIADSRYGVEGARQAPRHGGPATA